jgi:RNA polymerase sigma-70 factor (ECF subfamily)
MLLNSFKEKDYSSASDEELLALSVAIPSVFAVLIERYEKPFLKKARYILRNTEDAEDVVQETFTKIYLNAGHFKKQFGAQFSSWGYRILCNTCFSAYRRAKKKKEYTFNVPDDMYERIPDIYTRDFEKQEINDYVASILTRLPKNLATILSMHFLEGKPQKEIAVEQGLSIGAVKTSVYRAKKAFREVSGQII